jgi:hypothetical protein
MPVNWDLDQNGDLNLLDAIAYEFFMDHLNSYIDVVNEEDEVDVQVAKLAWASFNVGEIFVLARNKYYEQNNDIDA